MILPNDSAVSCFQPISKPTFKEPQPQQVALNGPAKCFLCLPEPSNVSLNKKLYPRYGLMKGQCLTKMCYEKTILDSFDL